MPSTQISPSVSKARKSTSRTLTTLRPPRLRVGVLEEPARDAVDRRPGHHRVGERRRGRGRRRPRCTRSIMRRRRARAVLGGRRRGIAASRLGSQRRPSSSSTVVTISTRICVTARSGAESQTKVRLLDEPGAADEDRGREAMVLRPLGRPDRAAAAHQPHQREGRVERRGRSRQRTRSSPRAAPAIRPARSTVRKRMRSCTWRRSLPRCPSSRAGAASRGRSSPARTASRRRSGRISQGPPRGLVLIRRPKAT